MSIKFRTIEQCRRQTLEVIKKILKNYNDIDFSVEITRDDYTKVEIGKIITLKLRNI